MRRAKLTTSVSISVALFFFPANLSGAARSADVEAAIDLAHSAPAEVAADALIRIAGLDGIAKKRRIELLDQAFALASAAPQPYKRRSGLDHAEGPSVFLTRVYEQGLDTQSLQLRAIEALLPLDAASARERFREMAPMNLPQLGCDDFLVYDPARFYEVLGQIAAQAFSTKDSRDGEQASFLGRYLSTISSAVQVAPAARLLRNAPVTDSQFQTLVTGLAGALGRISGDDRSFSSGAREAGPEIRGLITVIERRQMSPAVLLQAYRLFLANNLSAARCADTPSSESAEDPASFFNSRLALPALQPLGENELAPAKREGQAKGVDWCESPECQAMRNQYRSLVLREEGGIYQPAEREQSGWQAKVRDFVNALFSWTQSSGTSAVEHFREQIGFYNQLLALVPNGSLREFIFRSYLDFLIQNRPAPENRMEWLFAVSQLVGRVSLDAGGLGQIAEDLRRANDPVISLYMLLAAVAPQPIGEVTLRL